MNRLIPAKKPYLQKNILYTAILVALCGILFSSCATTKNTYYFRTIPRDTSINSSGAKTAETKIRKNDLLSLTVSSLNREEDLTYNAPAFSSGTTPSAGVSANGYLVDAEGNIQYHRLGTIHAEGMTRRELKDKIQHDITPYLKDPVVTVRFLNHRVTVLGEVARPQVLPMPEEQLSLLEVLGSSGDVTQFARRDNILIIRETDNGKQTKRINLEDHSVFSSDWYYLQPNDVVYVEPNDKKLKEEKRNRTQQSVSIGLSALSIAVIILSRIIK